MGEECLRKKFKNHTQTLHKHKRKCLSFIFPPHKLSRRLKMQGTSATGASQMLPLPTELSNTCNFFFLTSAIISAEPFRASSCILKLSQGDPCLVASRISLRVMALLWWQKDSLTASRLTCSSCQCSRAPPASKIQGHPLKSEWVWDRNSPKMRQRSEGPRGKGGMVQPSTHGFCGFVHLTGHRSGCDEGTYQLSEEAGRRGNCSCVRKITFVWMIQSNSGHVN